jgi:hypothetical protein
LSFNRLTDEVLIRDTIRAAADVDATSLMTDPRCTEATVPRTGCVRSFAMGVEYVTKAGLVKTFPRHMSWSGPGFAPTFG